MERLSDLIKLIIFDYDGVIVDSFSGTYEAYKVIGKKLNKKIPETLEAFRKIYGYTYHECYENLGIIPSEYEKAEAIYKEETLKQEPKLFDGIKEVLKELKHYYTLVLVSANYNQVIKKQLEKYGLSNIFDVILGKGSTIELPVQKMGKFIKLMKQYKATQEETVMIGDREVDYNHAQEAGIKHKIIVEYGWGYNKEKLKEWKQKVIVHKPLDLIKAIETLD